jgi:hypothetical protein
MSITRQPATEVAREDEGRASFPLGLHIFPLGLHIFATEAEDLLLAQVDESDGPR